MKCTYCGGTEFFEGPSGGMSTNILCANPKCRHWFNHTPVLDQLEDLHWVEPSAEEKEAEQAKIKSDYELAVETLRKEGADAFREGKSIHTLRTRRAYGGYAEAEQNITAMCGFIDAMAEAIRSTKS